MAITCWYAYFTQDTPAFSGIFHFLHLPLLATVGRINKKVGKTPTKYQKS